MGITDDFPDLPPEVLVQDFMKRVKSGSSPDGESFMAPLLPSLHVVSVSKTPTPRVVFRYTVREADCNVLGNLHGGCTATLFDFCSSVPLLMVRRRGFWAMLGVSRKLGVTYLRPVPAGTVVLIDCEIVSVGRRLAALRASMRADRSDGKEGELLTTCEHDKVNIDPPAQL